MSHTTRPKRSATKATPDASDDALLNAADTMSANSDYLWHRLYNGLAGPLNRQQRAAIARAQTVQMIFKRGALPLFRALFRAQSWFLSWHFSIAWNIFTLNCNILAPNGA